uniref:NADH-ubiquinone oxidoreductase chain 2 n=1 Tax=Siboglinum fiordicum TaxID=27908 RepID=A0A0E3DRC1_9ANNE|nr:NADH dehydrogenase subunit 2 [Siboglinum fiordicum]AIL54873.1 NADH dehydrogenase subunit 2 [Siboglinum fiordicum]
MLKLFPSSPLLFSCFFLGTLIAISSSHWFFLWFGLELNLFSFIPILLSSSYSFEASIKYFLIQLFSSLMLISSVLSILIPSFKISNFIMMILFSLSLMTKLSIAPCHFWFPSVLSSISWTTCLLLMTWQKLIPLLIMILISPFYPLFIIFFLASVSSMVGGLGGMNQSQLRNLLAYSSISHMGWTLSIISILPMMSFMYFFCYSIILFPLIYTLLSFNFINNKQLFSLFSFNKPFYFLICISFLSLSGLPPLLGFFPKWMILMYLSKCNFFLMSFFLILGSLFTLFFYLSMIFPSMSLMKMPSISLNFKASSFLFWLFLFSLGILPVLTIF